jgi:two-component system chemotaxis response regulator CheB
MKPEIEGWIVALGASGGQGLNDLRDLLGALRHPCPAILLAVLHRPIDKVSNLREVLARGSNIPVMIATQAGRLEPGVCYIGEPAAHLTLAANNLAHLVIPEGEEFRNRTIDLLFHSLAKAAAPRIIGVVLSGSLDDGSRGLAAIHEAGGQVMVMTPDRARGGQMPANAIDYNGPEDFVGGAGEIAAEIDRVVAGSSAHEKGGGPKPAA